MSQENVYSALLQAWSVAKTSDANTYGVEIAIVTNVKDPEKQGRVKVCFPRLPGKPESDWARVAQAAAGSGRGFYWLPEVSDEVLVAFERGQTNLPYVIGSLWNGKDKPMKDAYTDENTTRMIQSKSGHQLVLSDKSGEEKITLGDKSGKRTITFDVKEKKFLIECGEGDFDLKAEKKLVLLCEDLEVKTKKTGKIQIGTRFDLKVAQKASFKAGPKMELKADKVNLNPPSLSIEALVTAAEEALQKAAAAAAAAAEEKKEQAAAAGPAAPSGAAPVPTSDVAGDAGGAAAARVADGGAAATDGEQKKGAAALDGTAWTKAPGDGNKGGAGEAAPATGEQPEAEAKGTEESAAPPAQTQPTAETQPAETQPAETQPQQQTPTVPRASLSSDAQNPQPTTAAFNLKIAIQNWAHGMAAQIACDQDIGDGNGTSPQALTVADNDGSASVAVNPPATGFNAGTFNFTLTVTPQSSDPVTAQIAVTVAAASQAPAATATLQIALEGINPDGQVSADYQQPLTLTWNVTGAAKAELSTKALPALTTFEGSTDQNGRLSMQLSLGALSSALASRVTMEDGSNVLRVWDCELADPDAASEDLSPRAPSGAPPRVPFSSILLQPLELPLGPDGSGGDTLVLDPGPRASVDILLTVIPADPQGKQQTAQVRADVTNFVADLVMSDDSPAPANMKCKLELAVVADQDDGDGGTGSGSQDA